MTKKLLSLILFCAMVFSFSAMAAEIEVVRSGELLDNGSFEEIGDDGAPVGLEISGEGWEIGTERAFDGEKFLVYRAEGAQSAAFILEGIITGNEYVLTAYAKGDTAARASFTVEWQFYNAADKLEYVKTASSHYKTGMAIDSKTWTMCTTTFKAPEGAQRARVLLRKLDKGEVMWDKVSVTGELGAPKCSSPPPPMAPMPTQGEAKPAKAWEGVKGNLLKNPDMETLTVNGEIADWEVSGGAYGDHMQVYKENPHGGNNAGWMYHNERMSMGQVVLRIVPGETYTLSAWMRADTNASPAMKIEWSGYDEKGIFKPMDGPNKYFTPSDEWTKVEIEAVAPEGASRASIMLRLLGEGSVYFDDVAFVGPQGELVVPDPVPLANAPVAIDGVELLENGGFEGTDGIEVYKGDWENNPYVMLDTEHVWEGKTSLKITTKESGYPWARFTLFDLEPGAKYAVTAWMSAEQIVGSGMAFKYEFYTGSPGTETIGKQTTGQYCGVTKGGWVQFMDTFIVPEGQPVLRLYARLYGTGTVWFDSMSLVKIDEVQPIEMLTDRSIFYFGEVKEGTATIQPTEFYKDFSGTAKYALLDGEAVLQEGEAPIVDGHSTFNFSTDHLKEKGKEYTVCAKVYKADGSFYREYKQIIHIYARPTKLTEEGVYIDENGKPFVPYIMYHVMSAENVPLVKEAGINVIQGYPSQSLLDACQENGVKLLAVLYPGMKPAGHPANIDNTVKMVTQFKDHPAMFAWAIMDEPGYNSTDPYETLRISYKTIRDIDDKNPTYILEAPGHGVQRTASYADILTVDPYMGNATDKKETGVYAYVKEALESPSIVYRRPVYSVNQTFDYNGYWPNGNDYRHQIYQAFLGGAGGVGGFAWGQARGADGKTTTLPNSDLWPSMVAFAEQEMELAREHFALGKYPVLNEEKTDKIWHHSFVKDGEVYVVVLNLTKESVTSDVPLTSFDGSVKVSAGAVQAIGTTSIPAVSDGKITVTLEPSQCVRYQISGSGIDASSLHESMINDIYMYPWARAQILEMEARGIANVYSGTSYAPGKAITRGDFAMFLVRTLGLTNDAGEQFADVDPAAEYAKELAVGRAAGILNGIGDNKYNPEAPITRQELMTIVSRGLALSGSSDISSFTDSGLVADWAMQHVSAMIASGLIKGNADGTLNPLGNTTRAETAVICYRILNR